MNPFPGLRPFEGDTDRYPFFGREEQIDGLLVRLRRERFLAVIGTSGSGKSSLVKAGLVPALHGGSMAGAGSRWRIAEFRPGLAPIANLAAALARATSADDLAHDVSPEQRRERLAFAASLIEATLRGGARGVVEAVVGAGLDEDENVLVLVDQFEELFRFARSGAASGEDAQEKAAFVKLLLEASADPDARISVALTMRSEFLGLCARYRDLPEKINAGLFLVPRLTRSQLQRAIEAPVHVAGAEIAPALVARLLNDVGDDPDQLPVLQHALMRTWDVARDDRRAGKAIDVTHYEAIGGMSEALSWHGDEIYAGLPDDRSRAIAERLFRALTDRVDDEGGVRRPTRFADAVAIVDAEPGELRIVVERFRAPDVAFLMPPPGDPLDDDAVLDIVHESLIRTWPLLTQWAREEAQSAQIYRRLAAAAALHARGEAGLYRDPELSIALAWQTTVKPNEAWARQYDPGFAQAKAFLEASAAERTRAERRRLRPLIAIVIALIGFGLMALLASFTLVFAAIGAVLAIAFLVVGFVILAARALGDSNLVIWPLGNAGTTLVGVASLAVSVAMFWVTMHGAVGYAASHLEQMPVTAQWFQGVVRALPPGEVDRVEIAAANDLRQEYREDHGLESASARALIGLLHATDPENGHALYFAGQYSYAARHSVPALTSINDDSFTDWFRYLEGAGPPGDVPTQSTDAGVCYHSAKGYCRQRSGWVRFLLAEEFFRASRECPARSHVYLEEAKNLAAGSLIDYPPGFSQDQTSEGLLASIVAALRRPAPPARGTIGC